MEIRVECSCRVPYKFEVEPIDGAMPCEIFCPHCGVEGTHYANRVLELAAELEKKMAPKAAAVQHSELRATIAPGTPVPISQIGKRNFCIEHKQNTVEECLTCKKPLCLGCMRKFGYFCSITCRKKAEARGDKIPVYDLQESVVSERAWRRFKQVASLVVLLLVGVVGGWGWYAFFGSQPSVIFSLPIPEGVHGVHAQFAGPNRVLVQFPDKLALYDVKGKRALWTRQLDVPSDGGAGLQPGDEDEKRGGAEAHLLSGAVWVLRGNRLSRLDLETGNESKRIDFEAPVTQAFFEQDAILVEGSKRNSRLFSRVWLRSGDVEQHEVNPPAAPPKASDSPVLAGRGRGPIPFRQAYVPAEGDFVQMEVKLIDEKLVTRNAMKAPEKSTFDKKEVGVLDTVHIAEETFNDLKRENGGGQVVEDQSQYEIKLRHLFSTDTSEWRGYVEGPSQFFPMKSVDVLVSGTSVQVFDKTNHPKWQSKLTYPVETRSGGDKPPLLEMADALFLYDKGVLTAFDRETGNVAWRLPSVGISNLQTDEEGMLYVTTTTADVDAIRYSEQSRISQRDAIVILKVHPKTGQVLWKSQGLGTDCAVSGKQVYVSSSRISHWEVLGSILNGGGGSAPTRFTMYRLDREKGETRWRLDRDQGPRMMDVSGTSILLLFDRDLQVLHYFTF